MIVKVWAHLSLVPGVYAVLRVYVYTNIKSHDTCILYQRVHLSANIHSTLHPTL